MCQGCISCPPPPPSPCMCMVVNLIFSFQTQNTANLRIITSKYCNVIQSLNSRHIMTRHQHDQVKQMSTSSECSERGEASICGLTLWCRLKGKSSEPPYSQLAKLISVLVKRFFSGWPRKWLCFQTSFWSVFQTAISGQTRDNFKEGFPKISLKMETCVGAGRVKEGGQD